MRTSSAISSASTMTLRVSPKPPSAFFAAALTTPIGALIAYPFISRVSDDVLGLALGFVAGVMVYISAAHLLPEAQEGEKKHSFVSFFYGRVPGAAVHWINRIKL